VKISDTKPLLNAALVFLLAVLASPQTVSNNVAAKDAFVSGTTFSTVAIQSNFLGNPESDNPDFNRAPDWLGALPQHPTVTPLPIPAPEPDVAFTVSQARAPPQC
jgi:hypothetical protein